MSKRNHWYDYLWVLTALYLALGFFNILFAWLGLLCFFIPLIMASTFGTKSYCNKYCGRGQLFELIGNRCCKTTPEKNPLEKNAAILSDGAARLHLYDYKQLPSDVRDCNCV